ncbi:MAG: Transcription elongation factor NusA-like protein [Promethearchaeota archaeon]|nr:MAG: Transcription elongation factor NusA-like protein [Candidatus Lokiarchaeota archaeon]
MKFLPACETCIKSGLLCLRCQEKLDEGEITPFELDLAKDFIEVEESGEFPTLSNISFYQAIDYQDVVILIVGKGDKIRFSQELINWIKDIYEIEQLILIEKTNNPRPIVEALISPARLISLNEIFLATGDIEYKAVLQKQDKNKILFTKQELEDLVLELSGQQIRVEFI